MSGERKIIFMVDDNISNLVVGRNLLSETYTIYTCNSGEKMFKLLEKVKPHLILLDIEMPEMDGYEVVQCLKDNQDTRDIPVVFLTAHDCEEKKGRGHSLGVMDYITKPFSPDFLLGRIETHIGTA